MSETKRINLLLTSVGRRIELVQAFKDAAQRLGVSLRVIGADISATAPALMYCDETVIVPRISSPEYIPTLVKICAEKQVNGLVPTIDTDLLLLAQEKQRFSDVGTTVFISAPEKIALCRDKRKTSDYFLSLGLHAPVAVSALEDYQGGFPAFIKPFDGSSSVGANRADTPEQLRQYAMQLDRYVIQPFAEGTEYTVDIFCDPQGNPVYITPRIRLAVRAGEVLKTQICHEDSILSEMRVLVEDFKPCGAITVQLIRNDRTGVNQYIEINPRFGGGAPLSMLAGADSAEALLRCLMGQRLSYMPRAASQGAVYSRFDRCVCVNHGENPGLEAVIFDLDDTLYDEKEYVRSGYSAVAQLIPEIDNAAEKLWQAFEKNLPAIDTVLEQAGLEQRKVACVEAYRSHMPKLHLREGMKQLLLWLREKGIKTGVLTDGRPEGQRKKLEALGLYDLVDTVLVTDELGGAQFRKPNDIAFRIMQGRLGVPYGKMVYVGDNPAKDFSAPRMLGMRYIYFRNSNGLYSRADFDGDAGVGSVAELQSMIDQVIG